MRPRCRKSSATRLNTAAVARSNFELDNGLERMFLISIRDKGRGIRNLDEILGGKYVSKTGMGLGMIGAKRLMDDFQVETEPGKGTVVTLGKTIPTKFTRLSTRN